MPKGDNFKTPEFRRKQAERMQLNNPMHRKDVREKSSLSHKGKTAWNKGLTVEDPRVAKNVENAVKLFKSPEYRVKTSVMRRKHLQDPVNHEQFRLAALKGNLTMNHDPSYRRKQSEMMVRLWQDSDWRDKTLKAILSGSQELPNSKEIELLEMLQKLGLNYEYVGDGKYFIAGASPDFVNREEHKIIELFGNYWHSKAITGIDEVEHEKDRILHYAKHGYLAIVIWESELQDPTFLEQKLMEFHSLNTLEALASALQTIV